MILNALYSEIKQKKRSYHFIEFMRFIHKELELVKSTNDPLVKVAKRIASKHEVIFAIAIATPSAVDSETVDIDSLSMLST